MGIDHTRLAFIVCPLLLVVAVAAVVAYLCGSRVVFVGAVGGALLSVIVPERIEYAHYVSAEHAFMAARWDTFWHILHWGLALSMIGGTVAAILHVRSRGSVDSVRAGHREGDETRSGWTTHREAQVGSTGEGERSDACSAGSTVVWVFGCVRLWLGTDA